ncbi:protein FAM151A [Lampris incognitus]|uniref:protein FAM151A n=1 Tax=Lampris incognitus TaxID=2546036 RepID=UPI0024B5FCD9|nr:protein FAM151A [Lampris incognitus]
MEQRETKEEQTQEKEGRWMERETNRGIEKGQHRVQLSVDTKCEDSDSETGERTVYLGCLSREQLVMSSVAAGLALLLIIITVTAVVVTKPSGSSATTFPTSGDMLDFLVQTGEISRPDGLLATWYHRANNMTAMKKALASDAMILEADVTVEGFGTPNQKPVPIMAHPPTIYSDNTLDQWLEAVLNSAKGIKLDFKSLVSVAPSLELLNEKAKSRGINRPVWLNADILKGPNVPAFLPTVNGTAFLQLIEEKFPNVTVSPGWQVAYAPPIFTETYTQTMVQEMYDIIKDIRQKVTFPVHALLVRRSWQHISWLLNQSSRFSLTLWQGSIHPTVSDLLFVRDNSHPARVYYDIYEPTLSAFKQAANQQGRQRLFYPGGDLMEYFYPTDTDLPSGRSHFPAAGTQRHSLAIDWFTISDRASLLAQLSGGVGGMLVVMVGSDSDRPHVPLVESSLNLNPLTLQEFLDLVQLADGPWGLYLQVQTQDLLDVSLRLLSSAYNREQLYRPVWVNVGVSNGSSSSQDSISCQEFVSKVERLFPHVTLVLRAESWPSQIPCGVRITSQRMALHLRRESLPSSGKELDTLMRATDRYDLVVEEGREGRKEDGESGTEAGSVLQALVMQRIGSRNTRLYRILHAQSTAPLLKQMDQS